MVMQAEAAAGGGCQEACVEVTALSGSVLVQYQDARHLDAFLCGGRSDPRGCACAEQLSSCGLCA